MMFEKHGGLVGPGGGPIGSQGRGIRPGMPVALEGLVASIVEHVVSGLNIEQRLSILDARTKAILEHLGIPEPELSVEEEPEEETAQG